MRFGASLESQDSQGSLCHVFGSFRAGCVGQHLLFCKEARESTDWTRCTTKQKNTCFSWPPFLGRANVWKCVFSYFWFLFFICFLYFWLGWAKVAKRLGEGPKKIGSPREGPDVFFWSRIDPSGAIPEQIGIGA